MTGRNFKGTKELDFLSLPASVVASVRISNHFLSDLRLIADSDL